MRELLYNVSKHGGAEGAGGSQPGATLTFFSTRGRQGVALTGGPEHDDIETRRQMIEHMRQGRPAHFGATMVKEVSRWVGTHFDAIARPVHPEALRRAIENIEDDNFDRVHEYPFPPTALIWWKAP